MTQAELFGQRELAAGHEPPLTLYADRPTPNYIRRRNGQPFKVTLRSRERKGRIVATVYTGEEDAAAIVNAVNAAALNALPPSAFAFPRDMAEGQTA